MNSPLLPSSVGGPTTETVGFLQAPAAQIADWFMSDDPTSHLHAPKWNDLDDVTSALRRTRSLTTRAFVPHGSWTLLLTNGPNGTDVGMLHTHATRSLGCVAIRAVSAGRPYPAAILEVCAPDGEPPLMVRRSIAAANDGGSWVFEQAGQAFDFEHPECYQAQRKADRFTTQMLHEYLRELGVPTDSAPDWKHTLAVRS